MVHNRTRCLGCRVVLRVILLSRASRYVPENETWSLTLPSRRLRGFNQQAGRMTTTSPSRRLGELVCRRRSVLRVATRLQARKIRLSAGTL
jgi:hypothetical protein